MEFMQIFLIAFCAILILFWYFHTKPANFPPGPLGLPLVGYLPFLGKHPYKTLTKLGEKYGNLFSLRLGHENVVVLNDWRAIKEALVNQAEVFNGRPTSILTEELVHSADIVFTEGPPWREKRRFTLNHLRDFGYGKSVMEKSSMDEIHKLLNKIKVDIKQDNHVDFAFVSSYFLNVIWAIVASKTFEPDDEVLIELAQTVRSIICNMTTTNVVIYMPYLIHVFQAHYRQFKKSAKKNHDFLNKTVNEHIATYQEGNPRDFIDVYLAEIFKKEKSKENTETFTREGVIQICHDMLLAGIETTTTTLLWILLYMATWPEIQHKVQKELDRVIGRQRLPCYQDRTVLNYVNAVILETHRYASIASLSVLHVTTSKTKLLGYTLPKRTIVIPNLWAVHHDPKYWKDPDTFRPERFLNDKGEIQKPEYLIPFSTGGRICLGKSLAEMNTFLFFTCLMQQFSFSYIPGEKQPSLEPIYNAALQTQPFKLLVNERQFL